MRVRMRRTGATALAVTAVVAAAAFVFVGSASAANFGVSILKDCQTPINVGDAYSCEFEISNTVQSSQLSVTVKTLSDTVFAAAGNQTFTESINNTVPGLILTGGATCDATSCTIPFGGSLTTPFISHYTATVADFPQLSDLGEFTWSEVCNGFAGCSGADNTGTATASADINPLDTQTATTIHDAAHNAVTSVALGSTVHDFVSVTDVLQNEPPPQGNVTVDFFTNGNCSGDPAETSASTPLDQNGQADVTSFPQTVDSAGQVSFLAHYAGGAGGAFNPSDGVCEPLTVLPNTPTIATALSASTVSVGTAVHDSATLSGATFDASGTVTYSVYSDNECETKVADGGTVNVADALVPNSNDVTLNTSGTYYWQAAYSGDANNAPANSPCSEEKLVVSPLVDLSVTKSGSPATQVLTTSSTITWTMVVKNNGPDTDTGVTVSDPMPGGNSFVSVSIDKAGATCTGGAILNCNIGTMASGELVTITLVTKPTTVGDQTNTVIVSGDKPETNTANNRASATVVTTQTFPAPPPVFCVAVSKVTPKQLFVGRKTKLTIHVTQHGKAVKGIHVRIKGPKIDIRTKASSSKGVITRTIKMRKAGILIFSPIASKRCNTRRVGVTNVFTPPVTG